MSEPVSQFAISIDQVSGYEFRVKFDKPHHAPLTTDEPAPLSKDAAPSPSRILAAAVGNCLSASLVFAAKKHGVALENLHADVKVSVGRNENRRLRITRIEVALDPRLDAEAMQKIKPALAVFEDFCTVTASVRGGVPVEVWVKGSEI